MNLLHHLIIHDLLYHSVLHVDILETNDKHTLIIMYMMLVVSLYSSLSDKTIVKNVLLEN